MQRDLRPGNSAHELLTEREVEAVYGLRVAWLRRRRREGGGPPFVKISKMVRYKRDDLQEFITAHRVQA